MIEKATKALRGVLGVGFCLAGLACATPPGGGTARYALPESGPGGVAGVQIDVDASALQGDRLAAFEAHGGAAALANAVAGELRRRSPSPCATPCTLGIRVTEFRLRSGDTAFWVGMMAGADSIDVTVEWKQGSEVRKRFETDTSTVLGGIAYASSVKRFERLLGTVAERIADGL